jgi:hypothetical protein
MATPRDGVQQPDIDTFSVRAGWLEDVSTKHSPDQCQHGVIDKLEAWPIPGPAIKCPFRPWIEHGDGIVVRRVCGYVDQDVRPPSQERDEPATSTQGADQADGRGNDGTMPDAVKLVRPVAHPCRRRGFVPRQSLHIGQHGQPGAVPRQPPGKVGQQVNDVRRDRTCHPGQHNTLRNAETPPARNQRGTCPKTVRDDVHAVSRSRARACV